MKTIFNKTARAELINRINSLDENSEAKWGKMNINQMLRHCILWDEVALGKRKLKQPFLSRLFGKMILKGFVKDDGPLKRYLPAVDKMKVNETIKSDLTSEKRKWISLINEYPHLSNQNYELPFFGKVKKEQAGYMAFKHADHHLRQFNA